MPEISRGRRMVHSDMCTHRLLEQRSKALLVEHRSPDIHRGLLLLLARLGGSPVGDGLAGSSFTCPPAAGLLLVISSTDERGRLRVVRPLEPPISGRQVSTHAGLQPLQHDAPRARRDVASSASRSHQDRTVPMQQPELCETLHTRIRCPCTSRRQGRRARTLSAWRHRPRHFANPINK